MKIEKKKKMSFYQLNYFIIESSVYASLLENEDTLIDLRYTEFYAEK